MGNVESVGAKEQAHASSAHCMRDVLAVMCQLTQYLMHALLPYFPCLTHPSIHSTSQLLGLFAVGHLPVQVHYRVLYISCVPSLENN